MGSFNLGKMTLGSLFKKPETIQYPTQTRFAPEGLKGHIEIDIESCIFCGICMKRCPTGALSVDKPEKTWSSDRFRCVQCGSCVRECPKSCLSMDPHYSAPATNKSIDVRVKPELTDEQKAVKQAQDAVKAAKIEAALKAKAAKEAAQS